MGDSLALTRLRVKGVDSLAQNGTQGVTLDSLAPIKLKILHLMDWRIELDLWSVLGLRFQGFLRAAVLEIFDGAARWSSHEPELVAGADPGYSLMTGQALTCLLGEIAL